jgi:hypothetical protein
MNKDVTYCSGRGCNIANRCKRYTDRPQTNVLVYCINPPTRVNCITREVQIIGGCDLYLQKGDIFNKVIENDIGND